jgi:DNA polymerase III epsilon subunit-like protein
MSCKICNNEGYIYICLNCGEQSFFDFDFGIHICENCFLNEDSQNCQRQICTHCSQQNNDVSLLVYANYFYNFGFNVTCIKEKKNLYNSNHHDFLKAPCHKWNHFNSERQKIETLRLYDWPNGSGLGVVLGYNKLRALDIDDCRDVNIFSAFLKILGLPHDYKWVVQSGSQRGFHILFYCEEHKYNTSDNKIKAFKPNNEYIGMFKQMELRWKNHLVLPPSLHSSTFNYSFINGWPVVNPHKISLKNLDLLLQEYCLIEPFKNSKNKKPVCKNCGDANDVVDPGGEYYRCSHCEHDIDINGDCATDDCEVCDNAKVVESSDDHIQTDTFPECKNCGDANDVIDPGGEYYWCSHCEHDVDINGECATDDCEVCDHAEVVDSSDEHIQTDTFPACENCGDANDVIDPGGEYYWCSHCEHDVDINGECATDDCEVCGHAEVVDSSDEHIQKDTFPACKNCGDANDVIDPGGKYYWCSHCEHDIDINGECATDDCEVCDHEEVVESSDEHIQTDTFPKCKNCGDATDVIDLGGEYYWCSHCEHDIDSNGNIVVPEDLKKIGKTISDIQNYNEPYYLFFDTETTGIPKKWDAPLTNLDNWPRLIQLAWLLYDSNGKLVSKKVTIIKPIGFQIPTESVKIHGITTEYALENGKSIKTVLLDFEKQCKKSKFIIAHNIDYDSKIIGSEFIRNLSKNPISNLEHLCTMRSSTNYCKIQDNYGYKWPKLSELHLKLFKKDFDNAHNALADIEATARCFWEMRKLKLI